MKNDITTKISLGAAKARFGNETGERVLEISTGKAYNGGAIETSATVYFYTASGGRQHCFALGSKADGDFSAKVFSSPCKRVTAAAIKKQHEHLQPNFAEVEKAAREFYA